MTAEPDHVDEGLCRMRYSFPDGSSYTLNMCPIRKNYMRRLLSEAGFERVRTYGDFQETYAEDDPDFFIHVAEKSALHLVRWGTASEDGKEDIRDITEDYYDSDDADTFYSTIWGGEDLHIGRYAETPDIRTASDRTIEVDDRPAAAARRRGARSRHGGRLWRRDAHAGAQDRLRGGLPQHLGDAERVQPRQDPRCQADRQDRRAPRRVRGRAGGGRSFDVVWSQDAFLHSDQRAGVLAEAWRVLKPGGHLIFTDPMQADDVPDPACCSRSMTACNSTAWAALASTATAAEALGFETLEQEDAVSDLRTHYSRVREELLANYDRNCARRAPRRISRQDGRGSAELGEGGR